nr:ATP-binding protein [Bacteroides sp. 519]
MQEYKKCTLTFGKKLFVSILGLFLVFVASFFLFLHFTEKDHKIELLANKLQNLNENINIRIQTMPDADLKHYLKLVCSSELRLTILNPDGDILYDNILNYTDSVINLSDRHEIQEALKDGRGTDVRRASQFLDVDYFFSATKYNDYIIRTAVPYSDKLVETLKAEYHYLWYAMLLAIILICIFYRVTNKLGISINQLRQFAIHIDKNEPYDDILKNISDDDELGEISQHIIRIYQRLHDTKEALYIEREKLIAHLRTSQEGLGVFEKDKTEILVNSLFNQYVNIISDKPLEKAEEVFDIPEFQPITNFIQKALKRARKSELRRKISVQKNGRIFLIRCIIFQDMSIEVSINDVTQEEQQSLVKRQLTQNIAHELKTPVSSIQAYLETIVSNPDIPPEKAKMFLDRCYEQSNRLARLLRDISVLTRMDEATDMIEMEKVDISVLVATIINEVALDLEKKQITIINHLSKKLVIRGNYSLLYSIFRNLMDNSIAYAGNNIQIIINNFREDENYYYFRFVDTGVGVDAEHLQRIFERFYRIDKGRSRKLGGTGLGLAIVKNAVLIHGGNISAKKSQSGGLEFIFTLSKDR